MILAQDQTNGAPNKGRETNSQTQKDTHVCKQKYILKNIHRYTKIPLNEENKKYDIYLLFTIIFYHDNALNSVANIK